MKNLDVNTVFLDESFSNIRELIATEPTPAPRSLSEPVPVLSVQPRPQIITSVPVTAIPVSSTVGIIPRVMTTSVSTSNPVTTVTSTETPVQIAQGFPPMLGGGGGGAPETDTENVERGVEEKMIFGVKSTYVYGLGVLAALGFVYFKYIKK